MDEKKAVVVIGAGMSGLAAIKACLEEKLNVICFEKSNSIGGNWNFSDTGFSCAKTTVLNISKEMMAYSDFPFPDKEPNFLVGHRYLAYLKKYASHFDLYRYIKLEHEVLSLEKGPDFDSMGNWKVQVKDKSTNTLKQVIAANLIICVGLYSIPRYPTFPGLDSFTGHISHSFHYKTPQQFVDKNVLVVGYGNWAYDIATEVGNVANKVHCCTEPGLLIISRMGPNGLPYDVSVENRFQLWKWNYLCAPDRSAKDLIKWCTPRIDLNAYGLPITNFNPEAHLICVNDVLPYSILNGKVEMHSPIERFTATGVIFQGKPEEYPLDAVVMSTGCNIPDLKLLFPNGEIATDDYASGFFKSVFPLNLEHQTVAFICAGRFNYSYGCNCDLQSRWVASVFSKRVSLPSKKDQELENANDLKGARSNRLPLVSQLPYLDRVAQLLGVKPNLFKLFFTDQKLFRACLFGPMVPYQYRLTGPHSWSKARETIFTVPERVRAGFGSRPGIDDQPQQSKCLKAVKHLLIAGVISTIIYQVYQNRIVTFRKCL